MQQEKVTFCRICEPFCGMIATVENDRLIGLRPDKDHPLSRGFACPKGMAYPAVQNDPDRVLHPLRKRPDGTFEQVSWHEATSEIARRVRHIRSRYGARSGAFYLGNPAALNYSNALWSLLFMRALGITHFFSAGSQDTNSRFVANHLLYGQIMQIPLPDIHHTEFLVLMGANPVVSHMSLCSVGRVAEELHAIENRGGRVVVIDPRRTETAREHQWLPILPDSDAWLLLSIINVLFAENLVDRARVAKIASGVESLRRLATPFPPEATAERTRIPAETVRGLARDLTQKRSAVYGRTGTCLGSAPTLVNFLMDAVNILAGNIDQRGGVVFGEPVLPLVQLDAYTDAFSSYVPAKTRIGAMPTVMGQEPAAFMAAEMTTPGPDQIRMLFVSAGNPVLSTPNGPELENALAGLDLMVSIDLYVTETNQHADFILPATAMYEREDLPVANGTFYLQPFVQATPAVVPPRGQARLEAEILQEIAEKAGVWPMPNPLVRLAAGVANLVHLPVTPRRVLDTLIRLGRGGDRFGLRRNGLTLDRLIANHPHGVMFADAVEVGRIRRVIRHRDKRIHLHHPEIRSEVQRLGQRREDPDFSLRLIGQREPRSENSWMHNVAALRAARAPHAARMHPEDVDDLGLTHLGPVRLVSASGHIELPVIATADISRGVVAVPHGWGHGGGSWKRANREPGANVNALASTNPADLDPLSGMSHLSGIRVRAERIDSVAPTGE
ncbi:molybdopterin-dependent oxidoreductase [Skermania sp. ID1734]|uniref:molybdopterin-dependent oxidoreductase n=1 Tax=Skermania sp. ID1734 TaxID=2597516 RepID=UPI00117E63D2|nr:molybdopterin-dependent oxidoreductase [Skermania sp. ID1734]TSE01182.1 molybdopterin-dependent oxidoreductase [Skermania sp. ID1734]